MDVTTHQEVNAVLRHFLAASRDILGEHFVGMYLDGSLALGDFNPHSSDIDYLVVTDSTLGEQAFAALREVHARFNAGNSPWATEVEALYVSREALRRADPAHAWLPHIQRGATETLVLDNLDSGWVLHLYVLREHGVPLAGPDTGSLIDPIAADVLRQAVAELMDSWWGPMAAGPAPKFERNLGYQMYTVLSMCRVLFTLQFGTVVSKPVAARWALDIPGAPGKDVITSALAWRKDDVVARAGSIRETTRLIEFTLGRCRRWKRTASRGR